MIRFVLIVKAIITVAFVIAVWRLWWIRWRSPSPENPCVHVMFVAAAIAGFLLTVSNTVTDDGSLFTINNVQGSDARELTEFVPSKTPVEIIAVSVSTENGVGETTVVFVTPGGEVGAYTVGLPANIVNTFAPHMYDVDRNGMIEKSEMIAAINDYLLNGTITKSELIEVINVYLFG